MKVKLDSVDPWKPVLRLNFAAFPVVIGSNGESHVQLHDRWVSERHCEICQENGALVVRDLDSEHGTLVNGKAIRQLALEPGDTLTIGIRALRVTYRTAKSQSTRSPQETSAC